MREVLNISREEELATEPKSKKINNQFERFTKEWLKRERKIEEKMLREAIDIVDQAFYEDKEIENYKRY